MCVAFRSLIHAGTSRRNPRLPSHSTCPFWQVTVGKLARFRYLAWLSIYFRLALNSYVGRGISLSQQVQVESTVLCSQCRQAFAPSDVVQIAGNWVCATCKPGYLGRVVASGVAGVSPRGWRYGGVGIRFGARFIDGIVMGIPVMILVFALLIPTISRAGKPPTPADPALAAFGLTALIAIFGASMLYEVLMLKKWGATVGKMACGLKVVRSDGSDLGWGICFGRFFMWNIVTSGIPYLNFILMLVTAIVAGTDNEKRAIHDRVCDTRVIYKQSLA